MLLLVAAFIMLPSGTHLLVPRVCNILYFRKSIALLCVVILFHSILFSWREISILQMRKVHAMFIIFQWISVLGKSVRRRARRSLSVHRAQTAPSVLSPGAIQMVVNAFFV
jgi:hypothetical protein